MKANIEIIAARLVALHDAVRAMPPEPGKRSGLHVIDVSEWADETPPTRLDCVLDRRSGLEYAAWCIGETLAATGGRDLMDDVFAEFEARTDSPKASSWLDHRWSGCGGGWFA